MVFWNVKLRTVAGTSFGQVQGDNVIAAGLQVSSGAVDFFFRGECIL